MRLTQRECSTLITLVGCDILRLSYKRHPISGELDLEVQAQLKHLRTILDKLSGEWVRRRR